MFLIDTNVLSELRRADRAHPVVAAWAKQHQLADQYLSVITLMELQIGVLALERRDGAAAAHLASWIKDRILHEFDGRIIPVELETAMACASLHVPRTRPNRDAFIAATALVHNFTLVTRNTRDFEPMGVKLFNPWTAT